MKFTNTDVVVRSHMGFVLTKDTVFFFCSGWNMNNNDIDNNIYIYTIYTCIQNVSVKLFTYHVIDEISKTLIPQSHNLILPIQFEKNVVV